METSNKPRLACARLTSRSFIDRSGLFHQISRQRNNVKWVVIESLSSVCTRSLVSSHCLPHCWLNGRSTASVGRQQFPHRNQFSALSLATIEHLLIGLRSPTTSTYSTSLPIEYS